MRLLAAKLCGRILTVLLRAANRVRLIARRLGTSGHPLAARRVMVVAYLLTGLTEHLLALTTRLLERDWEERDLPHWMHPRNPRWRELAEQQRREAEEDDEAA